MRKLQKIKLYKFMITIIFCTIACSFGVKLKAASVTGTTDSSGEVIITYISGKKRVYKNYKKTDYNGSYGSARGGNVTTTAILLSGMLDNSITPKTVHQGTNKYSETYAINHLKSYTKYDTKTAAKRLSALNSSTPTTVMMNQIFKNAGLKTKYVRTITSSSYTEVQNHLKKGYPVVFVTNKNKKYKGISLTGGTTAFAMLGLNTGGKAIVINPFNGKVNYSTVQKKSFSFTAKEIMKNFAVSANSKTKLYSGTNGGYILVYPKSFTTKVTSVKMSKSSAKLNKGDNLSLTSYVKPTTTDQSVTWKSSNTKVAVVTQKGTVKAVSAGTATITATSVQNKSYTAKCTITVYPGVIQSVKISSVSSELTVGQKKQLSATIDGGTKSGDTITWTSSNTAKATVSQSGLVTAVSAGTATITAKVGSKSHSVTIKVVNAKYSPSVLEGDIDVTIYAGSGDTRVYPSYSQASFNGSYGGNRGCAITATAIVMSGMLGKNITPTMVHQGTNQYSETYAINKLADSYTSLDSVTAAARIANLDNSTPTNMMLEKILNNAGLKTKYIKQIASSTYSEVYAHLAAGNPVIFTTHYSRTYNNVTLAGSWHTLVMVGLDSNGKAIVINPAGGKVNYTHVQKSYFHFTVSEILNNYQTSTYNASTKLYSGNRYGCILVWK